MCKPDIEKGEVHMGKFCTNCGKELGENAKFCSRCGKPTGDNMQNTPINVEHNGGKIEKKMVSDDKGNMPLVSNLFSSWNLSDVEICRLEKEMESYSYYTVDCSSNWQNNNLRRRYI